MARAYSPDMRLRVIARVESGGSRRETAEYYDVSAITAAIWLNAFARRAVVSCTRFC